MKLKHPEVNILVKSKSDFKLPFYTTRALYLYHSIWVEMKIWIVVMMAIAVNAVKAQSIIQNRRQPGLFGNAFMHTIPSRDSSLHSKWSFSRYASASLGYSFFKGGSASFVSIPFGLQLNRQLNNNLYAFTGVSVAPTYLNFNSAFIPSVNDKTGGSFFTKGNSLALFSRAELGLMYVNDAKTFSISGSIGVERNSVPVYYSAPAASGHNPAFLPNR